MEGADRAGSASKAGEDSGQKQEDTERQTPNLVYLRKSRVASLEPYPDSSASIAKK